MNKIEYIKCKKEATLYENFYLSASKYFYNNAFYFQNKGFTYEKSLVKINKFAKALLDLGLKKDDVITVCLPNIPEAFYLLFAINQIGAIGNMVHPLFNYAQMKENLATTGSKILFCLDLNFHQFKPLVLDGVKVFACSPTKELNFIKKIGYALINKQVLKIPSHCKLTKFYKKKPYLDYDKDNKKDAIYLHSGGTTGKSKTIALSAFALNALCSHGAHILEIDEPSNKYMLAVLPMFHGFGLCMGVLALINHGGTLVLMPKFSTNETIKYLKKGRINYILGIPTLFEALLSKKEFNGPILKNLLLSFVGGDFVSESLINRYNKRMEEAGSSCRLLEGYGLTETVTVCAVNRQSAQKKGTVGQPLPSVKFKIVDPETKKVLPPNTAGELYISGDTIMNGYRFCDKKANDEVFEVDKNGVKWVKTGDFCELDEDNYLVFKQRMKRIIKVNGIPVFPSAIEDVVMSTGFVFECAAIGVEDAKRGHMIKLFVVLNKNVAVTNPTEKINQAILDKEGVYAQPKEIVYLDKLPHTLIGKIDTKQLS